MEVVVAQFEQFARGDFSPFDDLPEDAEFVTSPEVPDAGVYRGEAARSWLHAWVDSFDRLTIEGTEFIDAGEHVFVALLQRGWPRGSQTVVEGRWWQVSTLRDGEVIRVQVFPTREAALEAAGLSE